MEGKEQSVITTGEDLFDHLSDYQLLLNRVIWHCVSYILKHLKEIQDILYISFPNVVMCVVMACEESHVDNTQLQYSNQILHLLNYKLQYTIQDKSLTPKYFGTGMPSSGILLEQRNTNPTHQTG
jgi:hypothetical protein